MTASVKFFCDFVPIVLNIYSQLAFRFVSCQEMSLVGLFSVFFPPFKSSSNLTDNDRLKP